MLDDARRRFAALLAHPVLQRLVGFAVDVLMPLRPLAAFASEHGSFFWLSLDGDNRCWTLRGFRWMGGGISYLPLQRRRMRLESRIPSSGNAATDPDEFGLINLGIPGQHGPRYDICTVDPALATEGDVTRQKKAVARQEATRAANYTETGKDDVRAEAGKDVQQENGSASAPGSGSDLTDVSTLRSGGLRVLDRDRLLAACKQLANEEAAKDHAKACLAGHALLLQDAEQLETGKRLLVGVRSSGNIEWRCPQFRQVTYHDPAPPDGAHDWIEHELERRLGVADGERRLELDAASLNSLDQVHIQQPKDPKNGDDVDHKVVTLIMDSTIAAWGGEPMGLPPTQPQKNGRTQAREARTSFAAVDELNISRTYSATSAARRNSSQKSEFEFAFWVALLRCLVPRR